MWLFSNENSAEVSLPSEYADTEVLVRDHVFKWIPASKYARDRDVAFHVITAWNPGAQRLENEYNREVNETLRADLERLGAEPVQAIGYARSSDHREESWAVTGLSSRQARRLGRRFGQTAIFHVAANGEILIISCRRFRPATMPLLPHPESRH